MDKAGIEGMERSAEALTDEEANHLVDCIFKVARENEQFTIDDVWDIAEIEETRGSGQLMQDARKAGICESTGYSVTKKRARGGRWSVTLWNSLVYKGHDDVRADS